MLKHIKKNKLLIYIITILLLIQQNIPIVQVFAETENITEIENQQEQLQPTEEITIEAKLAEKQNNNPKEKQIIVKYKNQDTKEQTKKQVKNKLKLEKLETKKQYKNLKIEILETDKTEDIPKIIQELINTNEVEYAQPNYQLNLLSIPQDQQITEQWAIYNYGQTINGQTGKAGIDINLLPAWEITKGTEQLTVGVLDTGTDINHIDLANNIYTNTQEIPDNKKDDDNNGYIDDITGWDFYNNDQTVIDSVYTEQHGTHIAGIIGAKHNEIGIAGIAPNIKIMPLKFIQNGIGYTSDAIEAIQYAEHHGVQIINCSFGSSAYNYALKEAIEDADILFVCAAGNNGNEEPIYPASYNLPNVISVSAVDNTGNLAPFANYGDAVDILAPGVDILSTIPDHTYQYLSGTSMAAPHVTGIAALLKSKESALTSNDLAYTIKQNTTVVESVYGEVQINGIVNAFNTLTNPLLYTGEEQIQTVVEDVYTGEEQAQTVVEDVYTENELAIMNIGVEPWLIEQIHYGENGVNPAIGNYSKTYIDMVLKSPGMDLEIKRIYNSKDESINRHFGKGWSFNYEGSVKADQYNNYRIIVKLPNSSKEAYLYYGAGKYVPEITNGTRNELIYVDNHFKLITKDQTVYEFSPEGWLTSITDKKGNITSIDVNPTNGRINSITNQAGKTFSIAFNTQGYIESITDIENNRTVTYNYQNITGNLLERVLDPNNNIANIYQYDTEGLLNTIKDADSKILEQITYYKTEDENYHKVKEQKIYKTETISNTYVYNYDNQNKKTTITDQNNHIIEKWYDDSNYITKSKDSEGKETTVEYYQEKGGIDWTVKNAEDYGRSHMAVAENNGKIYYIGGQIYHGYFGDGYGYCVVLSVRDSEEYTPVIDQYISISSVGPSYGRKDAGAATLYGKIYVAGGEEVIVNGWYPDFDIEWKIIDSVQKYDPSLGTWSDVANLNYARKFLSMVEVNGEIYVIGGINHDVSVANKVEKFNGISWNEVANTINSCSTYGRNDNIAVSFNNKIYIVDNNNYLEEYDPVTNTWTIYDDQIAPSGDLLTLDGTIFSINGDTGTAFKYDFQNKSWQILESPITLRGTNSYNAVECDGNIYLTLQNHSHYYYYTGETIHDVNVIVEGNYNPITQKNRYGEEKTITDRNGNTTRYERDIFGRITKITNPDQSTKEYTYDDKNNITSEKDEKGKYTFYIYDTDKINITKEIKPLNGTDIYEEGISNDADFAITQYKYYTAEEAFSLFGTNVKGLLKKVTDPEGNITEYTYYTDGNLKQIKEKKEDGTYNTTTYEYNNMGLKTAEITPKGYRTEYKYDLNGLIVKITQHGGETTRILYDKQGRITKKISPELYDPNIDGLNLAQPTQTYTGDHGTRKTYYLSGLLKTETNPENHTTTYTYDKYGNMKTKQLPNGAIYTYEYDVMNRLTKAYFKEDITDEAPKLLEEYTYITLPDGTTQKTETKYLNDTETATTTYTYDNMRRITKQEYPDETYEQITYYLNGKTKTIIDTNGSTTYFIYDGQNRLTEQWTPIEKEGEITKYVYTKTEYYKNGWVKTEKTGKEKVELYCIPTNYISKTFTYYPEGNIKAITYNDGRKKEYQYDADGNLTQKDTYTDQTNYNTITYQYNHLGKPEIKTVYVKNGDIYPYSTEDQTPKQLTTNYTYDKNGNLKTEETNGITITYGYDNLNRQTSISYQDEYVDQTGNIIVGTIEATKTYNWEGNIDSKTDANGSTTQYIYNQRGQLEKIQKTVTVEGITQNIITAYYYDLAGRKIAEVSPENYDSLKTLQEMNRTEWTYDKVGRVKTQKQIYYDEENQQWENYVSKAYKYDNLGNITKQLDALGYETGTGTTTDEKIETGCGTEYTYTLNNQIITTLDPETKDRALPYTTKYSYDVLGRKTTQYNAKGVITNYTYDDAGNILTITLQKNEQALQQTIQTNTYDNIGNLLTQTDANGNTITYEYNALNKLKKETHPCDETILQNIITYQYDELGRLKKTQDAEGTINLFTYDNAGRQLTQTEQNAQGQEAITITVAYDKNGNIRKQTDGNGNTTTNTYDELNRLTQATITVSVTQKTTTNTYDKNNNLLITTDWRNNTYTNIYDPLNRLKEKIDPYGKTIQKLEYNKNNTQIKSYDALNNLTEYQYDKNNRLTITTDPEGYTITKHYDDIGNIEWEEDRNKNRTTYTYDEHNRLTTVTNALQEITSYTYDSNGNLQNQTDAQGNTIIYEYNVKNLPIKKIDHGGRIEEEGYYTYNTSKIEQYTYYSDGSIKTKIDRNRNTTTYIYDTHGRIITQTVKDEQSQNTQTTSYQYDNNGNPTQTTNEEGTEYRQYDEQNRVTLKTVPIIGQTTYQYDIITGVEEGHTAEKTTDPKGNIVVKTYDKVGRIKIVEADGQTTTYTYHDNGNRHTIQYQDGTKQTYTYYPDNTLETLTHTDKNGQDIQTYSYDYDANNNQIAKTDSKGTTIYTYDELNRIKTIDEQFTGKLTTYTYDKAGNRKTETITENGQTTREATYTYNNQNRLTQTTTELQGDITQITKYSYDNNGNQTYKHTETISPAQENTQAEYSIFIAEETTPLPNTITINTYDLWNQLTQTKLEDKTISYTYNGQGYRTSKTTNGQTTRYLYEYDKIVLETDNVGNQIARHVYGINLISREVEGEKQYYLYNGHGDVTALIDIAGNITATYYYDAFGNITEQTGQADNPIRYAGYMYDEETELYYLNARYYNPKIARFITEDTYTGSMYNPLSLNLYTYCSNNPIMYIDPTGHWQQGDENLNQESRNRIKQLTNAWYDAEEQAEKDRIHAEADFIRADVANYNLKSSDGDSFDAAISEAISTSNKIDENGDKYLTANEWKNVSSPDKSKKEHLEFEHEQIVEKNENNTSVAVEDFYVENVVESTGSGGSSSEGTSESLLPSTELDDIEKAAREGVDVYIEKQLLYKNYSSWFPEFTIHEWSLGYRYEDNYRSKKERTEFINSMPIAVDVGISVYKGYQQAMLSGPNHPLLKLAEIGVYSLDNFASESLKPNARKIIKTKSVTVPMLNKAKEKMDAINNSPYKLLIIVKPARKRFINELDDLASRINNNYDYSIFGENATKYKKSMIDYIESIKYVNINYETSKANADYIIDQIEKKY